MAKNHIYHLNRFYNPYPYIYNFIEVLKVHQAKVYLKFQSNGQKTTNHSSKVNLNIKLNINETCIRKIIKI